MLEEMSQPSDERPPHPLERFGGGGWKGGLLRLTLGAGLVALVLWLGGSEVRERLSEPRILAMVLLGAAMHLGQRAVRIAKWREMLRGAELYRNDYGYLLRAQLVGLLANLVAPVSEAVKVWAVSRSRREVIVATASLASDSALHAGGIALVALFGILATGASDPWIWAGAGGMILGAAAVIVFVAAWRRSGVRRIRQLHPRVLAWLVPEVGFQLAVYALALHAIGAAVDVTTILALAPLLYLADLVVVTPSGLGLREALFAATLGLLGDAPSDASIAAGLLVSAMVFVGMIAGGTVGIVWAGRRPPPGAARWGHVAPPKDDSLGDEAVVRK